MRVVNPLRFLSILGMVFVLACQSAAPGAGTPGPAATPAPTKLTVILSATVDFLDVHTAKRAESFDVISNFAEGFVGRDPQTMAPIPSLALSWTTPDVNTWTFKLRTGVKFHNGEAFDAEAVKYNLTRVMDPKLPSAIGPTLVGIVASVEATDASTLTIRTKTPTPFLLERVMRLWFVPPKESAEKGPDYVSSHPVGTGPYKFVSWTPGQSVVLTRNEGYWGPKPAYKDITFREVLESGTALAELIAGSADIVKLIPNDQFDFVNRSGKASVQVVESQTVVETAVDQLGRGGPTPWTNKLVRQAANHAIDRESIAKNLMGGRGKAVGTTFAPLAFGYDAALKPYPYDLAKAKQLLTEAGFPNGFDSEIKVYPLGAFVDQNILGQALVADLAKAGIRLKITQVSSTEIGALVQGGKAGPVFLRQNQGAGTFDAALYFGFYTTGSVFSYYKNDEVEKIRVQAASTADQNQRKTLYAQAQKLLYDDPGAIYGWVGFVANGVSNSVSIPVQPDAVLRLFLAKPK